jgi:predicted Ser/Thr protein kinase
MNRRRRRVNEIFHAALAISASRRTCAERVRRHRHLDGLSSGFHERTEQFLSAPAALPADQTGTAGTLASRRVGEQIGQYRISRVLGEGGMGVVYLAEDMRLGRAVALKAISPEVTADPARRERLRREARAAAALTHPGIATVYALEEFGDDIFIAGEFIAGETLREEVAHGPADAARVLETAVELAHALAAAHAQGVIHRDLKPENVIRTPAGRLKILDFGLARMCDVPPDLAHLTDDGKVFGTPGYMSPEQIRRGTVDARSDLFALGILLHELLTGEHPFGRTNSAAMIARILESEPVLSTGPMQGTRDRGALHQGLTGVIRVLLRKDPGGRFASAHELLAALECVRAGGPTPDPAVGASRTAAQRWWRFHEVAASLSYALLLVAAGFAADSIKSRRLAMVLFLLALAPAVAAVTLRLHLWFSAASMPDQWVAQHPRWRCCGRRRSSWRAGDDWVRDSERAQRAGHAAGRGRRARPARRDDHRAGDYAGGVRTGAAKWLRRLTSARVIEADASLRATRPAINPVPNGGVRLSVMDSHSAMTPAATCS